MARDRELQDLARRSGLSRDPGLQVLVDSPLLSPKRRDKLKSYLAYLAAVNSPVNLPFSPGPSPEEGRQGDLAIGLRVVTGRGPQHEFRLNSADLLGVSQVDGPTGAGKSIVLFRMALAVHRLGRAVHLFDTEGDMTSFAVAADPDLPVVRPSMLRQDVSQGPAGMRLGWGQYYSKYISTWREALEAGDMMQSLARQVGLELRERQGSFTLFDFQQCLSRKKYSARSREQGAWASLTNRLVGNILPFLGKTFSGGSHDPRVLFSTSVVWDLQELSDDQLGFFLTGLLLWATLVRPFSSNPKLDLFCVFDEVTRFCSVERMHRATMSEPLLLDVARTCRKRGMGLGTATQTPQLLPKQLSSNTNTWIVLRPADGPSHGAVSRSLNLKPDQQDYLMQMPDREPREAVVRVPGIADPFLVRLPSGWLPVATPEEIERRVAASQEWLDSIYLPSLGPAPSMPLFEDQGEPVHVDRPHDLTKEQIDYLVMVSDTLEPVTVRDRKNNISDYKGNKLRKALDENGLIRLHRMSLGGRGRVVTLAEVTEEGRRVLDRLEVASRPPPGRGSIEHRYAQQVIYEWCVRQGYPAQIEAERQGARVDVASEWDNLKVAVEFVNEGLDKELTNVERDLEAGFDQVVLVAVEKEIIEKLRDLVMQKLNSELVSSGRVSFARLTTFLEKKKG